MDVLWVCVTALLCGALEYVSGHGRLIEPPSRATMWRYGFDTPPNYSDHELYCGGYSRQWSKNGGKCGVCGDPWDMPKPRPHEAGGQYGNGIIVRRYKMDSAFTIRVELTANHKGYFEFRLCPNNAPHRVATQGCLDTHILKQAKSRDGRAYGDEPAIEHPSKYFPANGSKVFDMRYQLPKGLTCTQCVLQWRYFAGNNWGMCPNGTGQVGCGPQEEFRACADVAVLDSTGAADETPFDNEIPVDEEPIKPGAEPSEPQDSTAFWVVAVAIVFATLFTLVVIFGLVYFYFSQRDNMRGWWESSDISIISKNSEKQTQFWERFKDKELKFWRTNAVVPEKDPGYTIPQPVPPPRAKREPKGV